MITRRLQVVIATLAVWQAACWLGLAPERLAPSPFAVIAGIWELAFRGLPPGSRLFGHAIASLARVLCGFALAAVPGVVLGVLAGWRRSVETVVDPLSSLLRPIPPLAWIPLAILWFGIGLPSAAFIIALAAFFPILLATQNGVRSTPRPLIEAALLLGAKGRRLVFKVIAPSALPQIITGLGVGWMTLVAAEFTGVKNGLGLGHMILTGRDLMRADLVVAGMAAIGLLGFAMDAGVKLLAARALRWTRLSEGAP